MVQYFAKMQLFMKAMTVAVLTAFCTTSVGPVDAHAQAGINLPPPGQMVRLSPAYVPLQLKGIQVYDKNPLRFDFLIDKGDSHLFGQPLKDEMTRLSKYFLTCLTVPETDMWVNLSPYEKDRITAAGFGVTQMGKDLLEQDYLLKQITASSSYPESKLGKEFWANVYKRAYALYGTTEVPASTFNKIWIVPKSARVYVRGKSAFITGSKLDVMMETDYLALKQQQVKPSAGGYNRAYTQVFKEVILPELRREVNEGKNFAVVRQVYDAMILATWYKRHLKDGLLGKAYVGKNKTDGIDVDDKTVKEKIFQQYLTSFKKQVYNYIREDYDPLTQKTVPRKYVAGGVVMQFGLSASGSAVYAEDALHPPTSFGPNMDDMAMVSIDLVKARGGNIVSFPPSQLLPSHGLTQMLRADPAMAGRMGRSLRHAAVLIAIAVGAMALPSLAQGAVISGGKDGVYTVQMEQGDSRLGLGGILQQIGVTDRLFGSKGAVAQVTVKHEGQVVAKTGLRAGKTYEISIPSTVNVKPAAGIELGATAAVSKAVIVAMPAAAGGASPRGGGDNDKLTPQALPTHTAAIAPVGLPAVASVPPSAATVQDSNGVTSQADRILARYAADAAPARDRPAVAAPQPVLVSTQAVTGESLADTLLKKYSGDPGAPRDERPSVPTHPSSGTGRGDSLTSSPEMISLALAAVLAIGFAAVRLKGRFKVLLKTPSRSTRTPAESERQKNITNEADDTIRAALRRSRGPVPVPGGVVMGLNRSMAPGSVEEDARGKQLFTDMMDMEKKRQQERAAGKPAARRPSPSAPAGVPPSASRWVMMASYPLLFVSGLLGAFWLGDSTALVYSLPAIPLLATLHEFQHMFAAGLMTGQWREAFSRENIRSSGLSFSTAFIRPSVSLPMAKQGRANTVVRHAGFWGTMALGGIALGVISMLEAVLMSPYFITALSATAVVGTSSLISDIALKRLTQQAGDFFCGVSGLIQPGTRGGTPLIQDNQQQTKVVDMARFRERVPNADAVVPWLERYGARDSSFRWWKNNQRFSIVANDNLQKSIYEHFGDVEGKVIWANLKHRNLLTSIRWMTLSVADAVGDRGTQQKGANIFLATGEHLKKLMKIKRGMEISLARGVVFYRLLDEKFTKIFINALPPVIHTSNPFAGPNVINLKQHNRFATQGEMVGTTSKKQRLIDAAHPFISKSLEIVYGFDPSGTLKKVAMYVTHLFTENGDNFGFFLGLHDSDRKVLRANNLKAGADKKVKLEFFDMRRFFPSITHMRYEGKVTTKYLRKNVIIAAKDRLASNDDEGDTGDVDKKAPKMRYGQLLSEMTKAGYVVDGYVKEEFHGFSEEFKAHFRKVSGHDWTESTLNSVESALWAFSPGDAPLGAGVMDFLAAQGRPQAAMRKAYYIFSGFEDYDSLMGHIVSRADEERVADVFAQVFDEAAPFLTRPLLLSTQDRQKTLKDLWVRDRQTSIAENLDGQLVLLKGFESMLFNRIKGEIEDGTAAGKVFERWMQQWAAANPHATASDSLRAFIALAVKYFLTSDLPSATREFAAWSAGSFGVAVENNIHPVTVLYNNFQDVIVGYDSEGKIGYASDARALKAKDEDGRVIENWMQLRQKQEVLTITHTHSGIVFKEMFRNDREWGYFVRRAKTAGWIEELSPRAVALVVPLDRILEEGNTVFGREEFNALFDVIQESLLQKAHISSAQLQKNGTWNEFSEAALRKRFVPNKEIVDGKRNPYYIGGPVEYADKKNITGQDLENSPAILSLAFDEDNNPQSFNRRTVRNLARQLNDIILKHGKARLLMVGHDNSEELTQHMAQVLGQFIPKDKLEIVVVDSNSFILDPEEYLAVNDDNTVALFTTKSGATYNTKMAAYTTARMMDLKRIFCITARKDSVMTEILGQSLQPDAEFTERFIFTGDFYPSEAPVVSDMLLMYWQINAVLRLPLELAEMSGSDKWNFKFPVSRIQEMRELFGEWTAKQMDEVAGKRKWRSTGRYIGNVLKQGFRLRWASILFTFSLFFPGSALVYFSDWMTGHSSLGHTMALFATFALSIGGFPFLYKAIDSKLIGRPKNARLSQPLLVVASTQDAVHETVGSFIIRLFSLSIASLGPKWAPDGHAQKKLLGKVAPGVGRGDIVLLFRSQHEEEALSQVSQTIFPTTGAGFGLNWFKGRAQLLDVVVRVPAMSQRDARGKEVVGNGKPLADMKAQKVIDSTIGAMGQLIASKVIMVTASRMASFNGRMWNDAHTFNRAGAHTTENGANHENENIQRIWAANDNERFDPDQWLLTGTDSAMAASAGAKPPEARAAVHVSGRKGGVDMNSRLMDLTVDEDPAHRAGPAEKNMWNVSIDGITPQVKDIVPLNPQMIKQLLGDPS